jgi:hypothetical protein
MNSKMRMKNIWNILAILLLLVIFMTAAAAAVVWPPKNPSREFQRASRILKEMPTDIQEHSVIDIPSWELFGSLTKKQLAIFNKPGFTKVLLSKLTPLEIKTYKQHYGATEFGKNLVFLVQRVNIPIKTMTPVQRKAFDSIVNAYRQMNKDKPDGDILTVLYKHGASKDLANAAIGFDTPGNASVKLVITVMDPKTKTIKWSTLLEPSIGWI